MNPDLNKKAMPEFDTFSANSLKILDKSMEEFRLKYIDNLYFTPDNKQAKKGQNLHSFLCYYLKNFDTSKFETAMAEKDLEFIENIKEFDEIKLLKNADKKSIEQPFLIKCTPEKSPCFYLTGRFDAVLSKDNEIKIYDWKTLNLPKNPENDIQTIVYLFAASKLYKTTKVTIKYISLTKNESIEISYTPEFDYFKRIFEIVKKLYI